MANDPQFNVYMDLRPGEMQFINNYHVLHGRTAYVDDAASGHKRHLKRLWLATRSLRSRPEPLRQAPRALGAQAHRQPHPSRRQGAVRVARTLPKIISLSY